MIYKKRGQITAFIILGIIILMASAVFIYLQNQSLSIDPRNTHKKTDVLDKYVEECLILNLNNALSIASATGGYINYPFLIQNDPASYLKTSPIDEVKMPYWWYNGENRIPPLEFIQHQIEEYIISNIDSCIDNFSAVPGYDVYKTGDVDVKVSFGKDDVLAEMKYPLKAVKIPQQNEFNYNDYDFFIKVPIRFKEVYNVAEKIVQDEIDDTFLEYFTVDLISLGDPKYTPIANMDFDLKPRIWRFSKVIDELKDLLSKNLQYIKFENTDYNPYPDNFDYMKNHYIWSFDTEYHKNIRAGVTYNTNWPFRIDISPTKGGILKSGTTQFGNVLSFIGIQTWHFTYDLVYPVIITITDESTSKNDEYTFSLSTLVSIKNNRPHKENFGSEVFTRPDMPSEKEQCDYLMDSYNVPITVRTYNEFTKSPVRNINLTFTCGRYNCPLGKTDWTTNGASAVLKTNFPYCTWGALRGHKEGYEDVEYFMDATEGKVVTLEFRPVKEYLNYTVVKHYFVPDNAWNKVGKEEELEKDEQAVIMIKVKNGTDQFGTYPIDSPMPIKLFKDIDFAYNITIYLFDNENNELLGGYEGEFTVDSRAIEDNDNIKFHVLQYSSESEEDLALFITGLKSYSKELTKTIEFIEE